MTYRRLNDDYLDENVEIGDSDGDNQPMYIPISDEELIQQPTQFSGQSNNNFQANNSPSVYTSDEISTTPFETENNKQLRFSSLTGNVSLPQLKDHEQLFFKLVSQGNTELVEKFLAKRENFNVNCTNFKGQTALHIAMESKNDDMVNFLLKLKHLEVTDCALHAVRLNRPTILVKILDRLKEVSPELEYSGCSYSTDFSVNMTPLIAAAQFGNYDIIGILLGRGHFIPRPHGPCCLCKEECLRIIESEDVFLMIGALLDVYRAIGNPAYICHVSKDPILYAFDLSIELQQCASVYAVFKENFLVLAYNVKLFAADLAGCCRSCEEVNTILSQTEGIKLQENLMFPRLILAMNLKQKEFVAVSGVQQLLENAMIGSWYRFRCLSNTQRILIVIPRVFMLPFIVIVSIVSPSSEYGVHYSNPMNRLVNHFASYIIFLGLLYLHSSRDKSDQRRKMNLSGYEIPIALFVVGRTLKMVKLCIVHGPKLYLRSHWHKYNVAMETLFILYFIALTIAYVQVLKATEEEQELERKYWHYLDLQLVAEAIFAVATIMSYIRLLLYIQIQPDIGPLQVALGKMIFDILRYTVLFLIVLMAFNTGLCKLYSYYAGMTQVDPDTQTLTRQEDAFTNSIDTLKSLFWGMFSITDPDSSNLVIENLAGDEGTTILNEHYLTEAVGSYSFAIYMVLTVIIILNMMIGTMANTYKKVIDNVKVEWVYGRTEIYLLYTQVSILPPPFNLLPVPIGYDSCSECIMRNSLGCFSPTKQVQVNQDGRRLSEIAEDEYAKLMILLVQRYFRRKTGHYSKIVRRKTQNLYF